MSGPVNYSLEDIARQMGDLTAAVRGELTSGRDEAEIIGMVAMAVVRSIQTATPQVEVTDPAATLGASIVAGVAVVHLTREQNETIRLTAELEGAKQDAKTWWNKLEATRTELREAESQIAKAKALFIYGPGTTEGDEKNR